VVSWEVMCARVAGSEGGREVLVVVDGGSAVGVGAAILVRI
jgi:hypothetical protein